MLSNRDYGLFLEDILESIDKIEDYTKDLTFEEFQDDEKTIDAVVRNFEIIGEAVNNIPEDLKLRSFTFEKISLLPSAGRVTAPGRFQSRTNRPSTGTRATMSC